MSFFQTLQAHRRLAARLRAMPRSSLNPESRQAIKTTFLREFLAHPTGPTEPLADRGWSSRLAWAGGIASLVIALGAGTVAVAQTAGPGDPLYGLDRAIDRAHLALGLNAKHKAEIAASIAEERQLELQKIDQTTSTDGTVKAQAETDADEALDRAIEAVGKVKTQSEKNLEAITTRAEQKVNHLIELREKHRAREDDREKTVDTESDDRDDSGDQAPNLGPDEDGPANAATSESEDDDDRDSGEDVKVQIQGSGRIKVR